MSKLNKIIYLIRKKADIRIIRYTVLAIIIILVMPISAYAKLDFDQPASYAKTFSSLVQPLYGQFVSDAKASVLADRDKFLSLLGFETKKKKDPPAPPPQVVVKETKKIVVTAYSSTPDQTDSTPFITATGNFVKEGVVAANFLKFGTKIRLPQVYGDKIFVVQDRMASYNSHKLDIWMGSRNEALQFGVKRLTLEILK